MIHHCNNISNSKTSNTKTTPELSDRRIEDWMNLWFELMREIGAVTEIDALLEFNY